MKHDDIEQWLEQRRVRPPEGPAPVLYGLDHAIAALDAAVSRIRLAQPGDPPVPRGWLLHGRPGTGKSALTGRALRALGPDVAAYDLAVQWLTPERLSRALAYLAERELAVILCPEIDSWGTDRSWSSDAQSRKLLFAALEGFDSLGRQTDPTRGFVLIATTNRRSSLDSGLLRPGRIDVQISCPLPGPADRRRILESVLAPWPTEPLDLDVAAAQTASWSPAELRGAVDQAVGRALSRGGRGTRVSQADVMGSIRVNGRLDREDAPEVVADRLRVAAAHEAGHVAVSVWFGRIPTAVTLRDTGDGFTQGREDGIRDERELREMIVVAFGGIAGERLVIGSGSTGSADDVAQATRIAVSLVEAGLQPDFPPVNRAALAERGPRAVEEPLADHVMETLAHARERAETIVGMQRDAVERLAERLIETPMLAGSSLRAAIEEAGFTVSTTSERTTDPWTSAHS